MIVVMEARHPGPLDFANERIWIVAENFSSQPEVDRSGRKVSAIPKKLAMLCENTDWICLCQQSGALPHMAHVHAHPHMTHVPVARERA